MKTNISFVQKLCKLMQSVTIIFLIPVIIFSQTGETFNNSYWNLQSLEGERIFFSKHKLASGMVLGDIYSMNSNGGDVRQLTSFSDDFFVTERPTLSGDGTKLGFLSNFNEWKSTNYIDAFTLNLINGKLERVTGYERTTPITATGTVNVTVSDPKGYAFTPSGIRISYSGCTNFVTGNSAALTVPAGEEIWVKAVVARSKGDLKLVTVPSGGNVSLQLDLMNGTLSAEYCSLSPNGSLMAASRHSENISNEGEPFGFYKNMIWDTKSKELIAEAGGLNVGSDKNPAYSPDGSKLAVCVGEELANSLAILSSSSITATPDILVEGKRFFNLESCGDPVWMQDGSAIVFVYTILSDIYIQSNLYKVPVSGGTPVRLTNYSGNEIVSRPAVSPDGSKIAYNRLKSNNSTFLSEDLLKINFTSDIYVIPSNGGTPLALTNDGNGLDPAWGIVGNPVNMEEAMEIPKTYKLYQNYSNPFNPTTTIEYVIPKSTFVNLKIYDLLGNEVSKLVSTKKSAGNHSVKYNAHNLASGIYIYRLETEAYNETKKLIFLK